LMSRGKKHTAEQIIGYLHDRISRRFEIPSLGAGIQEAAT